MSLSSIATAFEAFAADAIADVKDEVIDFLADTANAAKHSLEDLVEKLGEDATKFVAALMNDDTLKGTEKADLAARQLVEAAGTKGITLAGHQATTLIESGYVALKDQINKIKL